MEDQIEILECTKCGEQVEQILALQCEHNLCLCCSGKILIKTVNRQMLKCEICGQCTLLDPSAIEVILQGQQEKLQQESGSKNILQQSMLQSEPPLQTIQTRRMESQITCQNHPSEIAQLYCLQCQTGCFCMECYLQGLHKNHDVKNTQKYYSSMKQTKVDQIWQKIKHGQDTLLNDQCRLTNKKRELVEVVSAAKLQIQQNFEQLYQVMKQKELELTQTADELIADKLQIVDNEIIKIKRFNEKLVEFSDKINNHYLEQSPNIELAVSAFNFFANNIKKIENLLDSIFQSQKDDTPLLTVNYTLDQSSVTSFLEDIKTLKLKITSLKAIDQNDLSLKEKYFYERAKDERTKRLFKSIVKGKELTESRINNQENNSNLMNSRYSANGDQRHSVNNIDSTLNEFQRKFQEVKRQLDINY